MCKTNWILPYSISISLFILISLTSLSAQPKITFLQDGEINPEMIGEYQTITIKPKGFTIRFEADELHVCTGLDEGFYEYAKPEIDINEDFTSYFFIFKYMAMSPDGHYLPVGKDVAASLNKVHGAKPTENNQYEYLVEFLRVDDHKMKLKKCSEFYMALWLDANKDQFIDSDEYMKVKVVLNK